MKLFFTIVLACTCIAGGSCLQCFTCSAVSDPCTLDITTCLSTITNCQTVSSQTITFLDESDFETISRIDQRCEVPSEDFSLRTGRVFISQNIHLCSSDRCNDQTEAEPANNTRNGLQCFGCFNSSTESCLANQQRVDCVGRQNRCVDGKGRQRLLPIGSNMVLKGCATTNLCELGVDLRAFSLLLSEVSCCEGALCNGDRGSTTTADPGRQRQDMIVIIIVLIVIAAFSIISLLVLVWRWGKRAVDPPAQRWAVGQLRYHDSAGSDMEPELA
ncbi:phospholipase A2 inhibitor and Ly6/PLAUR domain-containing protein-like [Stegostoma tigrinum]|uniref:phospholipase A2 inhibitor and Ly6/PLAUR domain-containing protein-like n=1 Tax=Stegostoma tigrinum TaxID=3053191 RepID=UPI0028703720|nr:phospholipase A2 inhibitor and Ly6/PLAUR domain-containing protein-like [Stegostoma tigrinum]